MRSLLAPAEGSHITSSKNSVQFGIIMAVITALCWAVLAILLKKALTFAGSGTIVWLRIVISWFVITLCFLFYKPKALKFSKQMSIKAIGAGVFISINYFGFMKCIEYTSASNAQIFIQLAPLGLALSGIFLFGEKLTRMQVTGLIATIVGFITFGQGQVFERSFFDPHILIGQAWILLAAATWIVYGIWQKQLIQNWSVNQINWWVFAAAAICLLPLARWQEIQALDFNEWILILILAANTLIAYTSLSVALKYAPATLVSIIIILNPILTLLLMWFINSMGHPFVQPEPIEPSGYMGAVIAVVGVMIVVTNGANKKRRLAR